MIRHVLVVAINLLLASGRTTDAIGLDGLCLDIGYPEDCNEAERCLTGETATNDEATTATSD